MIYNINRLVDNPAIAQSLGLSLQRATPLINSAIGTPTIQRIPARNPPGVPQPKPGIPIHPGRMKNQGDKASQKLIFPNVVECILLYFSVITMYIWFPYKTPYLSKPQYNTPLPKVHK